MVTQLTVEILLSETEGSSPALMRWAQLLRRRKRVGRRCYGYGPLLNSLCGQRCCSSGLSRREGSRRNTQEPATNTQEHATNTQRTRKQTLRRTTDTAHSAEPRIASCQELPRQTRPLMTTGRAAFLMSHLQQVIYTFYIFFLWRNETKISRKRQKFVITCTERRILVFLKFSYPFIKSSLLILLIIV